MSEIVIRHAEPKDYDAIRQIHAQPEVYHNTLQVPHPSEQMWQERLADQPVDVRHARLGGEVVHLVVCLLYTSPSPRDGLLSRMPSSA